MPRLGRQEGRSVLPLPAALRDPQLAVAVLAKHEVSHILISNSLVRFKIIPAKIDVPIIDDPP